MSGEITWIIIYCSTLLGGKLIKIAMIAGFKINLSKLVIFPNDGDLLVEGMLGTGII